MIEIINNINIEKEKIVKNMGKYSKYFWFFPIYLLLYVFTERVFSPNSYYISYCALDDLIPFNEYFIVPYFMWHIIIAVVSKYTFKNYPDAFEKLIRFFIFTCCLTFPIFILFPSTQCLRPIVFPRDNIFTDIVKLTYFFDTNTNVFPSMHVIGCVGLLLTCWKIDKLDNFFSHFVQIVIFIAITLSTVFVKQHSFLDVLFAIPVGIIGWWMAVADPEKFKKSGFNKIVMVLLKKEKVFTIPNILSFFRLLIIPFIIIAYSKYHNIAATIILMALSAASDILDGKIARKYNMVSSLGKALDPVADKLTQIAIMYILLEEYTMLKYLIILVIVKEIIQGIFGYLMIHKNSVVHSSQWFGKLATVTLYSSLINLIIFKNIPETIVTAIILICALIHILAFVLYVRFYLKELYPEYISEIRIRLLKGAGLLFWTVAIATVLVNREYITAGNIADFVSSDSITAVCLLLLLFVIQCITIIFPSAAIFAASAILFDIPQAIIINVFGIIIMSAIPYYFGISQGNDEIQRLGRKYPKLLSFGNYAKDNSFALTVALRINIAVNNTMGSIYLGAINIDWKNYYIGTIIGSLPHMLISTLVGYGINVSDNKITVISLFLEILLSIISMIVIGKKKEKPAN